MNNNNANVINVMPPGKKRRRRKRMGNSEIPFLSESEVFEYFDNLDGFDGL